jgi:hypothetical protein
MAKEGTAAAAEARNMRRESLFLIEEILQNLLAPAAVQRQAL